LTALIALMAVVIVLILIEIAQGLFEWRYLPLNPVVGAARSRVASTAKPPHRQLRLCSAGHEIPYSTTGFRGGLPDLPAPKALLKLPVT
jgi:hypothetical protein